MDIFSRRRTVSDLIPAFILVGAVFLLAVDVQPVVMGGHRLAGNETVEPAEEVFFWGRVQWRSGSPAHGVTVYLLREDSLQDSTYTTQRGVYAFYDKEGSPGEYRVRVVARGVVATERPVPDVSRGGEIPTITIE